MTAPVSNSVPVQVNNEDSLLASMKACGQSIISMAQPVRDIFSTMVSDICNKPFYDAKCPEGATTDVKVAHHVKETFVVLAKLTLIASGLYIATLSLTVLKVVILTALTILGLSYVARNEKIINKITETVNGIISKFPAKPATVTSVEEPAVNGEDGKAYRIPVATKTTEEPKAGVPVVEASVVNATKSFSEKMSEFFKENFKPIGT